MQKYAAVAVFCLCVGWASAGGLQPELQPIATELQPIKCPPGLVCLTKEQATALYESYTGMAALAEQAVAVAEEQQKIIERLKKSTNCS